MPTLQTRTVLAPGTSQEVVTEGNSNISIHCLKGQVAVEAFADAAAASGYGFLVSGTARTIPSAAKLIVHGTGAIDSEFEVHSAS